ncbi:MAG: molybdate ABC transporter permease subunit [Cytophagales bacterium]|nr:molybdate ABC transporter permease subunit [Cytophagales bacterium]
MTFSESTYQAIYLSVKVGLISTLVSLPFAILLGYWMARKNFIGKPVLEGIIHLPLVMPPVATGYLLLLIFGTKGIIGNWLFEVFGIRLAFAFPAAVLAAIVVAFPLMVRSIRTAMELIDPKLEQTSLLLGVSHIKTLFKITIPLAAPGIISGTVLAFARSLGEFGATISFAGNIPGETQTLPLAIYSKMQIPGEEQATFMLVAIAVGISFIAMILSEWSIKKMKLHG